MRCGGLCCGTDAVVLGPAPAYTVCSDRLEIDSLQKRVFPCGTFIHVNFSLLMQRSQSMFIAPGTTVGVPIFHRLFLTCHWMWVACQLGRITVTSDVAPIYGSKEVPQWVF